ncbi:MAG: preprotein translocase subunit SecE, partial [Methylohalobius sp.]|nr:preprotein translocase subunit SecE [Methylohalobius sp.]
MDSQIEGRGPSLDTFKLGGAAFLLILGIAGFYYFSGISLLVRVIALLLVGALAAFIAFQTQPGRQLWQFMADVRMEVRKVVWPSRQETLQTTLVVVSMVLILGIILW